jgi:hypothetical protein
MRCDSRNEKARMKKLIVILLLAGAWPVLADVEISPYQSGGVPPPPRSHGYCFYKMDGGRGSWYTQVYTSPDDHFWRTLEEDLYEAKKTPEGGTFRQCNRFHSLADAEESLRKGIAWNRERNQPAPIYDWPGMAGRDRGKKAVAPTPPSRDTTPKETAKESAEKLASSMAKVQPELDKTVQARVAPVLQHVVDAAEREEKEKARAVKAAAAKSQTEGNCRMVPDDRGLFAGSTAKSPAEGIAAAKSRIPANCSATGKTYCNRFADMPFASNKDFLPAFKKHMRDPQWKHQCYAAYTCAHHQKRVCDAPAGRTGEASRQ